MSADVENVEPKSLKDALEQLAYALERHRLIFLHFAEATRRDPAQGHGVSRPLETLSHPDIPRYSEYVDDMDSKGEFLLRNQWFLEVFLEKAISRFGSGEGQKLNTAEKLCWWALEEGAAIHLEESADLVYRAASAVRPFDPAGEFEDILGRAVDAAHDTAGDGKQKPWEPWEWANWTYPRVVHAVIAEVKRVTLIGQLAAEVDKATTAKPPEGRMRRGRKSADDATKKKEAQLAANWVRAKDSGTYKGDFAEQIGMTTRAFDTLLNRVAKRKSRSDK